MHLFMHTTVLGPGIVAFKGEEAVRQQFARENAELTEWSKEGAFICFPTTHAAHSFVLYVICVLVVFFFLGNICFLISYRQVQNARLKIAVPTTYEMQRMLFVVLSLQLENGSLLTSIALTVLSWHGVVDYFVMLYFISPWRREIIGWIRRASGKQTASTPVSSC
ncbi:hypothetical protein M3Y99_01090700 [Aphelenchoides fujianensis]|nr:hypothetical protein M3Y99_01090700 [Aphelenchoides fujianensis]